MTNLKVKQKIGNKVQHNYNSKDVQLGAQRVQQMVQYQYFGGEVNEYIYIEP